MKNFIFFIVLCFSQAACSTPGTARSENGTLLSFQDLANEITVAYDDMDRQERGRSPEANPIGTP